MDCCRPTRGLALTLRCCRTTIEARVGCGRDIFSGLSYRGSLGRIPSGRRAGGRLRRLPEEGRGGHSRRGPQEGLLAPKPPLLGSHEKERRGGDLPSEERGQV